MRYGLWRGLLQDSLHKPLDFWGEGEEQDAEENGRSSNDAKVCHFRGWRIEFNHLRIHRLGRRAGQEP